MAWARVRRGEVVETWDQIPASVVINAKRYDNKIFRNAKARAELGIMEIEYAPKPNAQRYNITKTTVAFNPQTGKVEGTYETAERPVDGAKATLLGKVKPMYEAKLNDGFVYMGNKYDVDDKSVMYIDIESRAAQDPNVTWPANYAWRDYDNDLVQMGQAQMINFAYAARDHRLALQTAKWTHEAQIAALTTHDEVDAYDLEALWP